MDSIFNKYLTLIYPSIGRNQNLSKISCSVQLNKNTVKYTSKHFPIFQRFVNILLKPIEQTWNKIKNYNNYKSRKKQTVYLLKALNDNDPSIHKNFLNSLKKKKIWSYIDFNIPVTVNWQNSSKLILCLDKLYRNRCSQLFRIVNNEKAIIEQQQNQEDLDYLDNFYTVRKRRQNNGSKQMHKPIHVNVQTIYLQYDTVNENKKISQQKIHNQRIRNHKSSLGSYNYQTQNQVKFQHHNQDQIKCTFCREVSSLSKNSNDNYSKTKSVRTINRQYCRQHQQ